MKSFNFRSFFAVSAMVLLAACGGSAPSEHSGFTHTAAVVVHANAPVADCEAEGCNQPRIVDGLAEQYRFGAVQQQQQEVPVEPFEPVAPLAEAVEVADASEAARAAAGQVQ